uniref:Uncharacterized protein n=1 Tax=Rhizophora mucronata TaxID=61149 RepID=A0A2P2PIZ0_RHIMU
MILLEIRSSNTHCTCM